MGAENATDTWKIIQGSRKYCNYETKENKLQKNNIRDVWSGMKKITSFKQKEDQIDEVWTEQSQFNSIESPLIKQKMQRYLYM